MPRMVHVEILADDLPRAVGFYERVLGWEFAKGGGEAQAYFLAKTGPADKPGVDGALMGRHFPQGVIATVEVDDLEATLLKVEAAGGKKQHGPTLVPNVGNHAYCTDTEGNWFGVMQPLPR